MDNKRINHILNSDKQLRDFFNRRTTDYAALLENMSLQRNIKKHLLSGGVIRAAYGKMRGKAGDVMSCQ